MSLSFTPLVPASAQASTRYVPASPLACPTRTIPLRRFTAGKAILGGGLAVLSGTLIPAIRERLKQWLTPGSLPAKTMKRLRQAPLVYALLLRLGGL